ncbi:UNVERIFIED_CONTAM: Ig-like domain-containing protein, partial [Salmonella enterica subsp. enterica serovar Weltevreden]
QGLVVSFSTTGGTLSAGSGATNAQGIVEVSLTSPTQVGSATVTANVAGFAASQTIQFIAGPVNSIQFTPAPATIAPGRSTTLTARV